MKFIIKPRGFGKTEDAIRLAHLKSSYILCASKAHALKFSKEPTDMG